MKKLSAFVICLLLVVSMLSIQVFAANAPEEPIISLVEDKSFVEIDGQEVAVNQLEEKGYKLVLSPVLWDSKYIETADEQLKAACEKLKSDLATGLIKNVDSKLAVSEFFDVSVVNINDSTDVLECENVTLTIVMPDADKVFEVIDQVHNDTAWNVVKHTTAQDNGEDQEATITVTGDGTGLYAFLVSAELPNNGTGNKDEFVPSVEQTQASAAEMTVGTQSDRTNLFD